MTVFSGFYFHRFIRQKHRPQDIRVREILISGADTDLFDLVLLRKRRFCPECRRDRAPVGVTISPSTSRSVSSKPCAAAIFAVAGTGTGIKPCWQRANP